MYELRYNHWMFMKAKTLWCHHERDAMALNLQRVGEGNLSAPAEADGMLLSRKAERLAIDHGRVLAVDAKAGTIVLEVRYCDQGGYFRKIPYPPLVVPIPNAMPEEFRVPGASFEFRRPVDRNRPADYSDPNFMKGFRREHLWWASTDELERYMGVPGVVKMTDAEAGDLQSREPAEYTPTEEDVRWAESRLAECDPVAARSL